MALQLAGGQVGEAAVAAARSIIDSVPHSVILTRYVCCNVASCAGLLGCTGQQPNGELVKAAIAGTRECKPEECCRIWLCSCCLSRSDLITQANDS